MKHWLLILAFACLPACAQQVIVGYSGRPWFPQGPVYLWQCNEGTGDYAYSVRGTADTGTLSGSTKPSWTTLGAGGVYPALDFNGSTAYIACGGTSVIQPDSPFSILVVFKPDSVTGSHYLVSNYVSGTNNGFQLLRYTSTIQFNLIASGGGTALKQVQTATSSVAIGGLYHVVVTHTGNNASSGMTIYVNGADASSSRPYNGTCGVIASDAINIGRRPSATAGYYDGKLTHVAIYSRCLSATEVAGIYQRNK